MAVTETPALKIIEPLLKRYYKRSVPEALHVTTLTHYGLWTEERVKLDIRNGLVGWVFLVDRSGHVRWRAHGTPLPDELSTMVRLTK